jgi:hypothetical protein
MQVLFQPPPSEPGWILSHHPALQSLGFRLIRNCMFRIIAAFCLSQTGCGLETQIPAPLRPDGGFPALDYLLGSPWVPRFRPCYGGSVPMGLAPFRESRASRWMDVRARGRCPIHPLQRPRWSSSGGRKVIHSSAVKTRALLTGNHEGCPCSTGPALDVVIGRCVIASLEIGVQAV